MCSIAELDVLLDTTLHSEFAGRRTIRKDKRGHNEVTLSAFRIVGFPLGTNIRWLLTHYPLRTQMRILTILV